MRFLLFHQFFLAHGEPGNARFNEFCRVWSGLGHQVDVIAGQVSYQLGTRRSAAGERPDGARVLRAYTPGTYLDGWSGRMWAYGVSTVTQSVAALLRAPRPDVILASSPPLTVALPALLVAWLRRVPLVFEVRDLWPESVITAGILREGGATARTLYALERLACRRAARVAVVTPALGEDLVRRGLTTPERLLYVPNGATFGPGDEPLPSRRPPELGWDGRFVVAYCGVHGAANHVAQLLAAAELLRNAPDVLFVTVGDGPLAGDLAREAARRGLDNVRLLGALPPEDVPGLLAAADVGVACLRRLDTFKTVYPAKVFDYMAAGLPVLLCVDGAARRLVVDEARAGVYAEPEDPRALADAVLWLRDHADERRAMGARGFAFAREHHDRARLAQAYAAALAAEAR